MKRITSTDNSFYQSLKDLNTARGRREQGLFLAEGPHLVEEALQSNIVLRYLVVREDAESRFGGLLEAGRRAEAETVLLPERLFKAVADTESPQGILAVAETRRRPLGEVLGDGSLAVLLERVQDPGNLGTILRTALAVDAAFAVLADSTADPWSQKVVRSSQGAVFHLPIVETGSAVDAVRLLVDGGWHVACGHLDGEDFFRRQRHGRTAIVIGNEAAGVSEDTAAVCSGRYKLPMPGRAESLNAAVAAGIMLYDLWREQNAGAEHS